MFLRVSDANQKRWHQGGVGKGNDYVVDAHQDATPGCVCEQGSQEVFSMFVFMLERGQPVC